MSSTILFVRELSKRYGSFVALRDVSFEVPSGTVTAVIGSNGAGKTTLLNTIAGAVIPEQGSVTYRGRDIQGLPAWKVARLGIGRLFQDARTFETLTPIQNLVLAMEQPSDWSPASAFRVFPLAHKDRMAQAAVLLDRIGVEGNHTRPCRELSVGNKKLVGFSRLMADDCDLLLMDEPTSGLAPAMTEVVCKALTEASRSLGKTVLLVEHNLPFVAKIADFVIVLEGGNVRVVGPTSEVLADQGHRWAIIGL